MTNNLLIFILAVSGYLIGSLNFSIILSGSFRDDVRYYGSGNAGATNMMRTFGVKLGLLTFLLDGLKTVAAFCSGYFLSLNTVGTDMRAYAVMTATFCVLGHCFPLFFGLRGGKGVTACGILLILIDWRITLIALAVFVIVVLVSGYVSLGSMLGSLSFAFLELFLRSNPPEFTVYTFALPAFIAFMHRQNIVRLIKGTESKLSFKKKKEAL